jgi:hypothetical protein
VAFELDAQTFYERLRRHRAQILATTGAHRNQIRCNFLVTRYQKVWDALQRVFADLKADLFVAQVGLNQNPLIFQEIRSLVTYSCWRSVMPIITACTGASQAGSRPA